MTMNRLDARARLVFHYAREEADRLGHAVIESEHLLLGLLREGGIASQVMNAQGLTLDAARNRVIELIGRFERSRNAPPPAITALARRVMDLAGVEASNYQSPVITTGHVLLGMIQAGDGIAMGIINQTDGGTKAVRKATLAALQLPPDATDSVEDTMETSSLAGIVAVPADSVLARLMNRGAKPDPMVVTEVPKAIVLPEPDPDVTSSPELVVLEVPKAIVLPEPDPDVGSSPELVVQVPENLVVLTEPVLLEPVVPESEIPDSMLIDEAFEEVPSEPEDSIEAPSDSMSVDPVLKATDEVMINEVDTLPPAELPYPVEVESEIIVARAFESTPPEEQDLIASAPIEPDLQASIAPSESRIETVENTDLIRTRTSDYGLDSNRYAMSDDSEPELLTDEDPTSSAVPTTPAMSSLLESVPVSFNQPDAVVEPVLETVTEIVAPQLVETKQPSFEINAPEVVTPPIVALTELSGLINLTEPIEQSVLEPIEFDSTDTAPLEPVVTTEPNTQSIVLETTSEPISIPLEPVQFEQSEVILDQQPEMIEPPSAETPVQTIASPLHQAPVESVPHEVIAITEETPKTWDMVTASSMIKRHIIALGGGGFSQEPNNLLLDKYILEVASSAREVATPRVCFVSTAAGDNPDYIERFYAAFKTLNCQTSHLALFHTEDWADELEDMILGADVLYFSGGSTKNALALWSAWELEPIFKRAYEAGTVFTGLSAGAICWFEQFTTDSMGRSLSVMDGLGWLPGSFTPHYDAERFRKVSLEKFLRAEKIKPGFAADDGAALHFVNSEYIGAVSSRAEAKAYHVTLGRNRLVESPLETRFLGE